MVYCPECGSDDCSRISAYDYRCNSCENVFDVSEAPCDDEDEGDDYDW